MPMLEYHEEFCAGLCALITHAWLPEDQWLVKDGRWVKPRNVAIGVNAFCGKIGKRGVVPHRWARTHDYPPPGSNSRLPTATHGPQGRHTPIGFPVRTCHSAI